MPVDFFDVSPIAITFEYRVFKENRSLHEKDGLEWRQIPGLNYCPSPPLFPPTLILLLTLSLTLLLLAKLASTTPSSTFLVQGPIMAPVNLKFMSCFQLTLQGVLTLLLLANRNSINCISICRN